MKFVKVPFQRPGEQGQRLVPFPYPEDAGLIQQLMRKRKIEALRVWTIKAKTMAEAHDVHFRGEVETTEVIKAT